MAGLCALLISETSFLLTVVGVQARGPLGYRSTDVLNGGHLELNPTLCQPALLVFLTSP